MLQDIGKIKKCGKSFGKNFKAAKKIQEMLKLAKNVYKQCL